MSGDREGVVRVAESEIRELFPHLGSIESIDPLEVGHIHHTYVGIWQGPSGRVRYVHQRFNHRVFPQVLEVAANIERVTDFLRRNPSSRQTVRSETLHVERGRAGELISKSAAGSWWRTFRYVEDTVNYSECPNIAVAEEGAFAFGEFIRRLSGLDPKLLPEPIPFFMHTPRRIDALESMIQSDPHTRLRDVLDEVSFVRERTKRVRAFFERVSRGEFPIRVTHNDTKINNVLFDRRTGHAVCVVDLDLCMAGSVLYDTGELLRTAASTAAEDERDITRISIDPNRAAAIERGYLAGIGHLMSQVERREFLFSGWLNALNLVVRFLTDHIGGDTYFRIHRPGHNLDRTRAQMAVVRAFEGMEG